jgi:hypothetical protein
VAKAVSAPAPKPAAKPVAKPVAKPASSAAKSSINSGLSGNKNAASGGSIKSDLSKKTSGANNPTDSANASKESKEKVDDKRHDELVKNITLAYDDKDTKETKEGEKSDTRDSKTEDSKDTKETKGAEKNEESKDAKDSKDTEKTEESKDAKDTEKTEESKEAQDADKTEETNKADDKKLTPIEEQRQKFMEAMKDVGPERMERLQKMMDKFEERMDGRGEARMAAGLDEQQVDSEIEQDVMNTYKHMAELAGPDQQGQVFDQNTRQFLAENFMLHAADPTTMDQGSNSSCWLQAGTIVGMINSPDAMARYTSEVARTGSFKDAQGQQHQFNRGIFGLGSAERNWTIANSGNGSARSPVSKMFDEGMSAMVGRRTPDWGSFHGSQGSRNIMKKVTGKTFSDSGSLKNGSVRDTLLLDGGYLNYPISRHVTTMQLSKRDGQWYTVQDNQWGENQDYINGKVNGNLGDWNVSRMSNRFNHFNPGGNDQSLGPVGPAYVRNSNTFNNGPGPGPHRNFFNDFQSNNPTNQSPFGPVDNAPVTDSLEAKINQMTETGELNQTEEKKLRSYLDNLSEEGVSREQQEQYLPQLVTEIKAETASEKEKKEDKKQTDEKTAIKQ